MHEEFSELVSHYLGASTVQSLALVVNHKSEVCRDLNRVQESLDVDIILHYIRQCIVVHISRGTAHSHVDIRLTKALNDSRWTRKEMVSQSQQNDNNVTLVLTIVVVLPLPG